MGYGTGAIMAVPAHDERDYEFAKKFGLEIIEVIKSDKGVEKEAFTGDGELVNSDFLNGMKVEQSKAAMIKFLEEKGVGGAKTTYRLRDWVFSRQRYWGEPIPIVHCPKCGVVPVPESELPVKLPEVTNYEPTGTGESPLANVPEWVNTVCPVCAGPAKRETNTMPQWAGSCWYYLRYLDPKNDKTFVNPEIERECDPVDCYIGGAEHAVLHLLYSRFWHKVLYDLGYVKYKEPYAKLRHQGMILAYSYRGEDGVYHGYDEVDLSDLQNPKLKTTGEKLNSMVEKMSKSKKNVINPDDILHKYGADAFRMYEMFMGPFEASKPWDMKGIEGVNRFLKRVYAWGESVETDEVFLSTKELDILRSKTIVKVSEDIEKFNFNTAVSALMIYFNDLSKIKGVPLKHFKTFLALLHPFAPHITEELWSRRKCGPFLVKTAWPEADIMLLRSEDMGLGIQVNGKVRGSITVNASASDDEIKAKAFEEPNVKKHMEGKALVKVIIVPKRMVNIVVK